MKVPESLIALLRCPETHQALSPADPDTLKKVNEGIASQQLSNHGGELLDTEIEEGLMREDGKRLYPIRDGFPVMLIDESIDLEEKQ